MGLPGSDQREHARRKVNTGRAPGLVLIKGKIARFIGHGLSFLSAEKEHIDEFIAGKHGLHFEHAYQR